MPINDSPWGKDCGCGCVETAREYCSTANCSCTRIHTPDGFKVETVTPSRRSCGCKCTEEFDMTENLSEWDEKSRQYEEQVFLAQMTHSEVSGNVNRSWRIRLSTAGNMYSLLGPFGETVAPQQLTENPFIDRVWQSAASAISNESSEPYHIYQAGAAQDEGYFSPNLAHSCVGKKCAFATWSSQADTPSQYKGGSIMLSSYKDCGHGVIEVSSLVYNNFPPGQNLHAVKTLGGVRSSSLSDVVFSRSTATEQPEIASTHDPSLSYVTSWQATVNSSKTYVVELITSFTTWKMQIEHELRNVSVLTNVTNQTTNVTVEANVTVEHNTTVEKNVSMHDSRLANVSLRCAVENCSCSATGVSTTIWGRDCGCGCAEISRANCR